MRTGPGTYSVARGTFRVVHLPPTFALVLPFLRRLGVARTVDKHCPVTRRADMTHGQVIEAVMLHILQDNRRLPLYKLEDWAAKHNLARLYGCCAKCLDDDRVGRALTAVAPLAHELHMEIVTTLLMAYDVDVRAVLWDLTHVTFTGAYEGSELVEAGYGDKVLHQKQIKLSLHVDSETGLPVHYKPLAGATNQTPLANGFLQELQEHLECTDLIVVSDRAGISYENIVAYRAANAHFVGPLQATATESELVAKLRAETFKPLNYRSANAPDERYSYHAITLPFERQKHRKPLDVAGLVIHSTRKQREDEDRRQKLLKATLEKLDTVRGHLNKNRYARRAYALEQIPKKIHASLTGIVRWELSGEDKQLALHYEVDQAALAHAARADGRYLLVHNLDSSAEEIFAHYKRQYLVEHRFRNFNSDLRVHPIWLHNDDRIEALMLIWILALTVFVLLDLLSERAGLRNDPYYHKLTARAMIEQFDRATLVQIRIPDEPPECYIELTDRQIEILAALNINDPARLLIT
jgi:transposase